MTKRSPDPVELGLLPVERAPLSVLVSRQLRELILSGVVAPGAELPTEHQLTERFRVGRSTVREALRILQAEGLITGGDSISTTRPRVSSENTIASASRALENVVLLGQVPLPDLVALRLLIEGQALFEAAAEPVPEALAAAHVALDRMRRPDLDVDEYLSADLAFHIALVGTAGNRAYHLILGVLRDAVATHLRRSLAAVQDPRSVQRRLTSEHKAILEAVKQGDGETARQLVTGHVRRFYDTYGTEDPSG